jgi:hypothetical protein
VQASAALAKKSAPAERIAASVFAYRAAIMGGRGGKRGIEPLARRRTRESRRACVKLKHASLTAD